MKCITYAVIANRRPHFYFIHFVLSLPFYNNITEWKMVELKHAVMRYKVVW